VQRVADFHGYRVPTKNTGSEAVTVASTTAPRFFLGFGPVIVALVITSTFALLGRPFYA